MAINFDLYKEDTDSAEHWLKVTYQENFSSYFDVVSTLISKFNSEYKPISDEDLEEVLTTLPLSLFSVAEQLSEFKLKLEVVKLKLKEDKKDNKEDSEFISDGEFIVKAYQTLVERVEREISYSRELIMSAKKIWSARKQVETIGIPAENANFNDELPEYMPEDGTRI